MNDLLQAFPIAAIIIGQDDFVVHANELALGLLGRSIVDKHYVSVLRHPDVAEAIDHVLRQGGKRQARWFTTLASVDAVFNVSVHRINTAHALVTFEDATDFENTRQMRRDFVSNVSHELKTPLTSMLGFLETLQTIGQKDTVAQQRFLGIMTNEAHRMNRLVNDLLSLNRVENDERFQPTQKVDLVQIIRETLETLAPVAKKTDNTIVFDPNYAPAYLLGDRDQLCQVITNLVENALKYGGPAKDVCLVLSQKQYQPVLRQDGIVLDVIDEGRGIDPQFIPRLTERFYRVDDHRSRDVGGTGLGLSIVKHIVNRHRGRLTIKSTLGQGSTFSVCLPVV